MAICAIVLGGCGEAAAPTPAPNDPLTGPALIKGTAAVQNAYAAYEAVLSNPQRQSGDLATSKAFAGDVRAALDEFDATLREQSFGPGVRERVTATLAASGALSTALDSASKAATMELFAEDAVAIDGRVAELARAWGALDRALQEL